MKIVVLGASGMIGSAMYRVLAKQRDLEVFGTFRRSDAKQFFPPSLRERLISCADLANTDAILRLFVGLQPDVVINCVGLTKHLPEGNDPLPAITINAALPHRLGEMCALLDARLIHVSTDCVFSGRQGGYRESDDTDASDVYGKSKALGEVTGKRVLTLRTSTIGHELSTRHGLLEWFLTQRDCRGFRRAVFSGLPSVCFAEIVRDFVLPNPELNGLYNVGAAPINKYDMLCLINKVYGNAAHIVPDDNFVIDRSLDTSKFVDATGYTIQEWPTLIQAMKRYNME